MSNTDQARRVAEIAEYEIQDSPWGIQRIIRTKESIPVAVNFNPLHDANQCIEVLDRVFPEGWCYFYRPGEARPDRRHVIAMGIGNGPTFCAAAVAAILAAGGKGKS